jgi:hypothetical protein
MGKYIVGHLEGINYFFRFVILTLFSIATIGIISAIYLAFKAMIAWF